MPGKRERLLFYSITALGISSIITQIILIREFLSVFYGNELVFGVILANWLLLTGIGAYIGKFSDMVKNKVRFVIICQMFVAFLPFFSVYLLRTLRNVVFSVGSLVGIVEIFISSFVLLLPYCIISGFLLTLFCTVFSLKQDAASIGRVYFIDNIGDILGGFLFSFVLIYFLNHFQMIFFIMFINLLASLLLSIFIKSKVFRNILIFLIAFSFIFLIIDFNEISTQIQYKGQELVFQKDSLYGNLVVTRSAGQLNFFENGVMLFSTDNVIENEELVHYAMVQHENPRNVLLISGGAAGTINEILKYDVEEVDYVELDPLIVEISDRYIGEVSDDRVNIINMDARLFVKKAEKKYDVVLIDLPDPGTIQINRFYTIEFFYGLRKILDEKGVISLSLISTSNYINEEARQLNSVLYNTLKDVFSNVIVFPGGRNFFIASDSVLSYNVAGKVREKNISTEYVNEYYLNGTLTAGRISYLLGSMDKDTDVNRDFNPVTYYHHLLYWLSYFKVNYILFLFVVAILMVFFVFRLKPVSFAVFTTGFGASSLEVVLVIGFQIIYGYVYHMIGIIITMFLLGLAIGSFYMNKRLKVKSVNSFIFVEFLIVVYSVLLPFVLIFLSKVEGGFLFTQIIFSLLTLIIAILVGMEFPLASKLQFKKISSTAAALYNADLIGAALGALLVSALLIPLIGIINVCFFVAGLNLLSGFIIFFKRKNYISA
ncbi:MAG: fused MFS/spermidine synthase [Nanoarchaeota archaeon]|nr:fused MFS/spermidine synthase [Nanoarchaeota archaeon]